MRAIHFLASREDTLGGYAEFGVFNGTSMITMWRAAQTAGVSMSLTGFDSFLGLPPAADREDFGVWHRGQFSCPEAVARENLSAAGVSLREYTLVTGWYADTLTCDTEQPTRPISIVMIDCDTFSSATLALNFIEPRLTKHSVVLFDDWRLNDLDILGGGEYLAFEQFLEAHPNIRAWTFGRYARKTQMFYLVRDETGTRE